jgi:hypothetical protein
MSGLVRRCEQCAGAIVPAARQGQRADMAAGWIHVRAEDWMVDVHDAVPESDETAALRATAARIRRGVA